MELSVEVISRENPAMY